MAELAQAMFMDIKKGPFHYPNYEHDEHDEKPLKPDIKYPDVDLDLGPPSNSDSYHGHRNRDHSLNTDASGTMAFGQLGIVGRIRDDVTDDCPDPAVKPHPMSILRNCSFPGDAALKPADVYGKASDRSYFICLICGFKLTSAGRLQQHERGHEKVDRDAQDMFECPLDNCGAVFETEPDLYYHCEEHLHKSPKVCTMCGSAFLVDAQLKQHMSRHSEVHQCTFKGCGKWFLFGRELQGHMRSHESEKSLQCSLCSVSCASKQDYTAHMHSTHAQENLYLCDMPGCDKFFRKIYGLRQHKLTHCDERMHMCSGCNVNYKYAHSLNKHLRKETEQAPYVCQHEGCGQVFAMACVLTQHMATAHNIGSMCRHCGRVYNTPGYFEKHLATHMRRDLPEQFECDTQRIMNDEGYYGSSSMVQSTRGYALCGQSTSMTNMHDTRSSAGADTKPSPRDGHSLLKSLYSEPETGQSFAEAEYPGQVHWSPGSSNDLRTGHSPTEHKPRVPEKSPGSTSDISPKQRGPAEIAKGLSVEQCKNMMFNNLSKRHRSIILHTNAVSEKSVCRTCNAVFTSLDEFNVHMKFHASNEGQNICPGIQDKLEDSLTHAFIPPPRTVATNQTTNTSGQFKCLLPGCTKVCRTAGNLRQHMQGLHPYDEARIRCPCCNMYYKNRKSLQGHIKIEKMLAEYFCEEDGCSAVFPMGCVLVQHRAHVHGVGALCVKCGMVYKTEGGLLKHSKLHELPETSQDPSEDGLVCEFDGTKWATKDNPDQKCHNIAPANVRGSQQPGFELMGNSEDLQSSTEQDLSGTFEFEGSSYQVELQANSSNDPFLNVDEIDSSCPLILNVTNEDLSEEEREEVTEDSSPITDIKPSVESPETDQNPPRNPLIARIKQSSEVRYQAYSTPHKCSNCTESFLTNDKLRQHRRLCHGIKCSVCSEMLPTLAHLHEHTEKHHTRTIDVQHCPYPGCSAQFQFPGHLGKHILVDHIKKKHAPPVMNFGNLDHVDMSSQSMEQHWRHQGNVPGNPNFITGPAMTTNHGFMNEGSFGMTTDAPSFVRQEPQGSSDPTSKRHPMWHKPCTTTAQNQADAIVSVTVAATETDPLPVKSERMECL